MPALAALVILLSYLIGAVPTGYLLARRRGMDIRAVGSGGTGATNVLRNMGWQAGLLTVLIDVSKGLIAVALGTWAGGPQSWALAGCVVAAVAGHAWPVYIGFRGGKSVATAIGAVVAVFPTVALLGAALFVAVVYVTRYVSLGSLLVDLMIVTWGWLSPVSLAMKLMLTLSGAIVAYRHRGNIERLLAGTENRISLGGRKV